MFDYLGMGYKDSDYTVVVAIVHWPKHIILVLKLTMVELWAPLSSSWPPLLDHLFQLLLGVQPLGKAHKDADCTAMITIMHWRLLAKTHLGGEVASAVLE